MYINVDGPFFRNHIKKIALTVYNNGDESVRSSESDTCSVVNGPFIDIGSDESIGPTGTGESNEEVGPYECSEEQSDESETGSSGTPDDSFRSDDVVY
jgi:hypothetical protein